MIVPTVQLMERDLTPSSNRREEIVVESGRIVLVPILQKKVAMSDFCFMSDRPPGKMWLTIGTQRHMTKAKKRRVMWIELSEKRPEKPAAFISILSPLLFVGDATFLYVDKRKSAEYERAIQAARSESAMAGSFRTDDGQVAACVRLGDKEMSLWVVETPGLIRISTGPAA